MNKGKRNLRSLEGERERMKAWKTWLIRQHTKNMRLAWQMISLVVETDLAHTEIKRDDHIKQQAGVKPCFTDKRLTCQAFLHIDMVQKKGATATLPSQTHKEQEFKYINALQKEERRS